MLPAMLDAEQEVSRHPDSELARRIAAGELTGAERGAAYADIRAHTLGVREGLLDLNVVRSAWRETIAAAERHNDPGRFTTFIAYEFTGSPENQNLHRNVIFRGSAAPEVPFSRLDSFNPEELWAWMDRNREAGIEALAIPHNSNGSNGLMFRLATYAGEPLDAAYAAVRTRNEPLGRDHPDQGHVGQAPGPLPQRRMGGLRDLVLPDRRRHDPEPADRQLRARGVPERAAPGRGARHQPVPLRARRGPPTTMPARARPPSPTTSPPAAARSGAPRYRSIRRGRTGVSTAPRRSGRSGARRDSPGWWAEENTRASIYDAFRRKETFATTGPRMRLRFFGGYDYPDGLADDPDLTAAAYAGGVAMGGELVAPGPRIPKFLVWASRDPASSPLARLQVIKGWIDGGEAHERVYDVACSDGMSVDPETQRCPDNGATVDLDTCAVSDAGDAELRTLWTDPDFDATQRAVYYVRVLENPSCRWSTWEAIRAGVEPRPDLPATIQERAWSSPIWVTP